MADVIGRAAVDISCEMAERIEEYLGNCDYPSLIEIYKLCYGEDALVVELQEVLEK